MLWRRRLPWTLWKPASPSRSSALAGAHDRAGADVEGAGRIGEGGQLVEGAVCEAAVAGAEVVDAMGGEGEGEGKVDDTVPVEEEAEMAVDGDRVAGLENDGLGETDPSQ